MQILQLRVVAPLLVFGLLTTVGCEDNGSTTLLFNGGTGPSPRSDPQFVSRGVMVQPTSIQAHRVGDPLCPAHPPFLAPFNVVFQGDGRSDVFLSSVQMQFVDLAEMRAGVTTLGRPELDVRFGSTALPAFGTRVFPFSFPFGCAGLPGGTLTVIVVAGDSNGHERRTVTRIPVR